MRIISRYHPLVKHAIFLSLTLAVLAGLTLTSCGGTAQLLPTDEQPVPSQVASTSISTPGPSTPGPSTSETTITEVSTIPGRPAAQTDFPPTKNQSIQAATATQRVPPDPDSWVNLPIVPTVSETARQIYQRGISLGRNPHAFSKIGDCQSITTYFLALFDKPGLYQLGSQKDLQATIDWFAGSFERESLAVKGGLNAAAVLSPLRADPQLCQAGESPVACELRMHNPSIVFISLEEWWADDPTKYERYMRQIVEYAIDQGVLPILATKADNLEGNHLINQTIAHLAWEYDIPLWNFWSAVQPLPDHGLIKKTADGQPDMFHLTHSENYYNYSDLQALKSGWAMRNLTALQTLSSIWNGLNEQSNP